ncbi:M4 family metallopeptidase [Nocardioides sp. YIM 152315]|uniref:M4 family metallopeptidase n=1 Tax=Nocardioides sp. YIM 152315 TaxID=3031760 RepID=UPI0023DCB04B|nr:M4 family metallopeptidase [Nocardioides sp. YIM 152315]MDF1602734.1 M4 family metallopeptidase [Nocardioides sp. YIM 152315]
MRTLSGSAAVAALALIAGPVAVGATAPVAAASPSLETETTAYDVVDVVEDADGTTHTRMVRTYEGLPVIGGDRVVHRGPAGVRRGVSQTLEAPLALATKPVVGASAAARTALAKAPAIRDITGANEKTSRLVVDATSGTGRLAWEVVTGGTQADGTPSRLATYVDARSGKVLWREQQIQDVDGTGQSLYSGTVPLQLTRSGAAYQLKDPTRGNTYTTDLNNQEDPLLCQLFGFRCPTGTLFTSPDASFGNGAAGNRESAAVDAQYGTNMTWDFYQTTFGRNGIFGDGTGSYNRVHYGTDYVNAFWDGTKMTYGDGDGTDYGPLVSLDVAGHEMSHGVTEHTANLTYSGESGGLNEATSDIFGSMVEFFAANANDPGDYLIGEEFDLKNHLGLRRMDDPSSDGSSLNCWTSGAGDVDVHYSSGIGNHFFYLLSEGSGAKTLNGVSYDSPTCDGSTVSGIGRDAAGEIWYRALTVYMTSSTDYHGARTATLDAARDLFGAGSVQHNAVATAWSAVGVS